MYIYDNEQHTAPDAYSQEYEQRRWRREVHIAGCQHGGRTALWWHSSSCSSAGKWRAYEDRATWCSTRFRIVQEWRWTSHLHPQPRPAQDRAYARTATTFEESLPSLV